MRRTPAALVVASLFLGACSQVSNTFTTIPTDQQQASGAASPSSVSSELPGASQSTADPPAGVVWFGDSIDPQTGSLTNRLASVSVNQAFSVVAHLTRAIDGAELVLRITHDGTLYSRTPLGAQGTNDLWAFTPDALPEVGTWKYDYLDASGSVLASGEIQVAG